MFLERFDLQPFLESSLFTGFVIWFHFDFKLIISLPVVVTHYIFSWSCAHAVVLQLFDRFILGAFTMVGKSRSICHTAEVTSGRTLDSVVTYSFNHYKLPFTHFSGWFFRFHVKQGWTFVQQGWTFQSKTSHCYEGVGFLSLTLHNTTLS